MRIRKINLFLLMLGLLCVVFFVFVGFHIAESRDIRLNGQLIYAPITEITGRLTNPNSGIYVKINGEEYYSTGFDKKNYSIGDTIAVRYIPGKDRVIQERKNPNKSYLYYALDSLLLVAGIVLVVESFKGKSTWRYM